MDRVVVNRHLRPSGQSIKIGHGTIVDATIISTPNSTKNHDDERDPEMHQPTGARAKVGHSIGVIKRISCFRTVRHRGLVRNLHSLEVTAALANLFMVRRQLLRLQG